MLFLLRFPTYFFWNFYYAGDGASTGGGTTGGTLRHAMQPLRSRVADRPELCTKQVFASNSRLHQRNVEMICFVSPFESKSRVAQAKLDWLGSISIRRNFKQRS